MSTFRAKHLAHARKEEEQEDWSTDNRDD